MYDFIRIGTDPELFAFEGESPVSVHDLMPGTKAEPCKVPLGAIQVDGVAAEFNIEPAETSDAFLKNIRHVQDIMQKVVISQRPGLILRAVPTVTFDKAYFEDLPFSAKELGCEPDFSAYTGEANPKPHTDKPMRTGSGHIHIQFVKDFVDDPHNPVHMAQCCDLVKTLDATLYPLSLEWDKDEQRRELYGSKGSFRPKRYGVEYRVLSNAWLKDDATVRKVFDVTKEVTTKWLEKLDWLDAA